MKKAVVAMMMCMSLSLSLPVFAQETAPETTQETTQEAADAGTENAGPTELVWSDLMEAAFVQAGYSGTHYTIDALSMQLLVPDGLEQRQPTEEESEKDTILVFENEEEDKKIEFVLGQVGDCETLADVQAFMAENYPEVPVNETIINGYDTLVFGNEEADSMTVLIGAGEAGFLRVIFHPIEDPEMNQLFAMVAASIRPIEE